MIGRISDISDLQIGLQAATAVTVFGSLLMLLVIYFIRRDGLHHPRLAAFRTQNDAAHWQPKNGGQSTPSELSCGCAFLFT